MDLLTGRDEDGDVTFPDEQILSTDLKKKAGFGKGGEKNYPGIITGLQMQTYLVITDFRRRTNKRGEEYGMAVSIMLPPESVWGYENVTASKMGVPGYLAGYAVLVILIFCAVYLVDELLVRLMISEAK